MTNTPNIPSTPVPYEERLSWFHQARFGLFIHYGLYATAGRGEWVMFNERMPAAEYAEFTNSFNPAENCPRDWARVAVEAGMRYAVLTTRHHDGFSLFNSPVNDFNIWNTKQRDIVKEFVEACREFGLKVGFYYSLLDWRFPGYFEPEKYPESAEKLVKQVHAEVEHLMSAYGRIDILWYDGGWVDHGRTDIKEFANFWRSAELNQMVYDHQPHILINNRSGLKLDIDTPEQRVVASESGRAWESCMTIGDSAGWGWLRHNPNRKTLPTLLQNLVNCAANEGNYLINVGPRADGSFPFEDKERLQEMGRWLKKQGEGIYDSRYCELYDEREPGAPLGRWTRQGNTAYLYIFRWPGQKTTVPLVDCSPLEITLLATGESVNFKHDNSGRLHLLNLPEEPPHPAVNVLRIKFPSTPRRREEKDHAAWLKA